MTRYWAPSQTCTVLCVSPVVKYQLRVFTQLLIGFYVSSLLNFESSCCCTLGNSSLCGAFSAHVSVACYLILLLGSLAEHFFLLILIKFRPLIIDSQTFNVVAPTPSPESRSAPFSSDVIFPDLCFFVFISILFCSSLCLIFLPRCLDYCNFGHIVLKDQNCQIRLCFLKCWVGCLELYMCLNTL